jgi:methyl-accepting chemotaxis protein
MAPQGGTVAGKIKTLIDAAVANVDSSSRLVRQAGIGRDNQAITQMDEVMQQNAALVERAAAIAVSLQKQAAKLAQVVSLFRRER